MGTAVVVGAVAWIAASRSLVAARSFSSAACLVLLLLSAALMASPAASRTKAEITPRLAALAWYSPPLSQH